MTDVQLTVEEHLTPTDRREVLEGDARSGLTSTPKRLSPIWFYDERGSNLFDEITRLPEYYPTRSERGLLAAHATEIAELSGADTLVELGSGTSEKTRILLDAFRTAGTLDRFVPFDVSDRHTGFDTYDMTTQQGTSHHFSRLDDGSHRYSTSNFRYIWPAECDLMARLAGLEFAGRWADWDQSPFTSESLSHISVWRKPTEAT